MRRDDSHGITDAYHLTDIFDSEGFAVVYAL
jgi:hypothetical protein